MVLKSHTNLELVDATLIFKAVKVDDSCLNRPKEHIKKEVRVSHAIGISMPFVSYYCEGHQKCY